MEKNYQNILTALKYYIPIRYWNLNNWDIIIKREVEVEKNIFEYRCSFFILYFNEKLEPVEYGNQHIIDGKVYYFDKDDFINRGDVVLGRVDWYNQNTWGL